jgi:hypothetical protein
MYISNFLCIFMFFIPLIIGYISNVLYGIHTDTYKINNSIEDSNYDENINKIINLIKDIPSSTSTSKSEDNDNDKYIKMFDMTKLGNLSDVINGSNKIAIMFTTIQKLINNIMNLIYKFISILVIYIYNTLSVIITLTSIWNGTIQDITLSKRNYDENYKRDGFTTYNDSKCEKENVKIYKDSYNCCFHPDTKIKMNDGKYKKIKDIKINDIMENNIYVIATLEIIGNIKDSLNEENIYYKLFSNKLNDYIYVTGTHWLYDKKNNKAIQVKDIDDNEKTDIRSDKMYCLVTSNNFIRIGEYLFYDWEK